MSRALRRHAFILFFASSIGSVMSVERAASASSEAQALFDEGKRLMAKGSVDEACDRFERSQRLEPAGGTVLHLALCREMQGRTGTAYELFNLALSAARTAQRKDREQAAREHLADLEPKLVRLRIVVPRAVRIEGLEVSRDGEHLPPAAYDVAVPVDPGAHEIGARAPGRASWTKRVEVVSPGAVVDVEVPALATSDGPDARASTPAPKIEADAASAGDDGTSQRTLAVVALGIGAVGIGVGTVAGIMSASAHTETNRLCGGPAPVPCPQAGIDEGEKAQDFGNVSTVAFVIGAVGVAAGAVLWFTAPAKVKPYAAALLRGGVTF